MGSLSVLSGLAPHLSSAPSARASPIVREPGCSVNSSLFTCSIAPPSPSFQCVRPRRCSPGRMVPVVSFRICKSPQGVPSPAVKQGQRRGRWPAWSRAEGQQGASGEQQQTQEKQQAQEQQQAQGEGKEMQGEEGAPGAKGEEERTVAQWPGQQGKGQQWDSWRARRQRQRQKWQQQWSRLGMGQYQPGADTSALCWPPSSVDMLGAWFPSDRSLEQMLGALEGMLGAPSCAWPLGQPQGKGMLSADGGGLAWRQPWDVQESDEAFFLSFDLPGLSREDVEVKVGDGGVLSIKAEKFMPTESGPPGQQGSMEEQDQKQEEKQGAWRRAARRFQTQLKLPESVNVEEVSAEMRDGMLTITLPKIPPEEPRTVPIG